MFGDHLQYHHLEDPDSMLPSLMISAGRYGYFLKHKSDVFATFKKWKAEVENQSGLKDKGLRSDNRGEYDKSEFKAFFIAEGIRLMRTVPGKARQNGIAERMNRTLNERARSMKIHVGCPKHFGRML